MPAVICDIGQDILGADFIKKYKLGLEWDENDKLYITDKKAAIKEPVSVVTVPSNLQRVSALQPSPPESSSSSSSPDTAARLNSFPEQWLKSGLQKESRDNAAVAFQVACMKKLEEFSEEKQAAEPTKVEHEDHYLKLIRKLPQLLDHLLQYTHIT